MGNIRNGMWLFDILKIYFHANDGTQVPKKKNGVLNLSLMLFGMENNTKANTVALCLPLPFSLYLALALSLTEDKFKIYTEE